MSDLSRPAVMVKLDQLHDHPKNYRAHPQDQIDHLAKSIKDHGFYKNVVLARDMTILAGHGAVKAARQVGLVEIPAAILDISPSSPQAMRILIGDNEIEHLADQDDRLLADLLKELHDTAPDNLLGTGFDEMMLANLAFVTRPAHEITDHNEAAHWVGMPDYQEMSQEFKIVVTFRQREDRQDFLDKLGVKLSADSKSLRWPPTANDDISSISFTG